MITITNNNETKSQSSKPPPIRTDKRETQKHNVSDAIYWAHGGIKNNEVWGHYLTAKHAYNPQSIKWTDQGYIAARFTKYLTTIFR